MRDLMQVGISKPQIRFDQLRSRRDEVAEQFAAYLQYWLKSGRSRHELLKPVHEIVKLATKPLMTPGQAAGRAFRIHELASPGSVPKEAIKALELATHSFFALMDECPVHLRKTMSDRVLDHVYLLARKSQQQFWNEFTAWLKETKYQGNIEQLNKAWQLTLYLDSWDKVRYVKVADCPQKKDDLQEFRQSLVAQEKYLPPLDDVDSE